MIIVVGHQVLCGCCNPNRLTCDIPGGKNESTIAGAI